AHALADPRVVSLWDGSRLAGKWFADRSLGGLGEPGNVVWDAYLAFAGNARWQREPSGLVAAASDIIDNTNGLEQHFLPLLMSHCAVGSCDPLCRRLGADRVALIGAGGPATERALLRLRF